MPLHDWTDPTGWDGVHLLWIARLCQWLKPRLPEGYFLALPEVMQRQQTVFARTGGLHAAALFDPAGNLVVLRGTPQPLVYIRPR